jgi:hypothetical protein
VHQQPPYRSLQGLLLLLLLRRRRRRWRQHQWWFQQLPLLRPHRKQLFLHLCWTLLLSVAAWGLAQLAAEARSGKHPHQTRKEGRAASLLL